jgi:large subunit ribosomal protein L25
MVVDMNKLTATMRSKTDKLVDIRKSGMVPAVVYGARVENTTISVSSIDFEKILKAVGESSTLTLELKDKKIEVLIHEIQRDPVKGFPLHVDFLAIDINKPIVVMIPVEFTGVAPAEKNGLGVLVKTLHEIEVEALPKDLPHNIEVDLSVLENLDDQIRVESIKAPANVTIKTDSEEVLAIIAPMTEEKIEETPSVDISSIEVEKKGKKEEEGTDK